MGEESEKKRNSILSCLESALGDLFLEIAAKIPIENIEHNILPRNFGNILQLQAKLAKNSIKCDFSESNHLPQQVGHFAKIKQQNFQFWRLMSHSSNRYFKDMPPNCTFKNQGATKKFSLFIFNQMSGFELYRVLVSCLLNHVPFNFPYLIFSHRLENGIRF